MAIHPRRLPSPIAVASAAIAVVMALSGCAAAGGATAAAPAPPVPGTTAAVRVPALPPIPFVDGELTIEVGYPAEGATLATRGRNFVFGSTGSGRATLAINGTAVEVQPNGGFLAFVPVPDDGVYRLVAERDGRSTMLERTVRVPAAPEASPEGPVIVPGSAYPTGAIAALPGEPLAVGFRAPRGGDGWLVLPGGDRIRLVEAGALDAPGGPPGAFIVTPPGTSPATAPSPGASVPVTGPTGVAPAVRYEGVLAARPLVTLDAATPRPLVGSLEAPAAGSGRAPSTVADANAYFELVLGSDTVRAPLRLNLAVLTDGLPRIAVATPPDGAAPDWRARGRNDVSGPYHYFWPEGARFRVTGERGGMLRVALAPGRSAWLPPSEVRLLPDGAAPPDVFVGDVRLYPDSGHVDVRVPTPARLPFQVLVESDEIHLDVFGAAARTNFFQYGRLDPLVEEASWSQPSDGVYRVSLRLSAPVWGYETFFDESGAVVLRVRRPPTIDARAPLRGLRIVVDAGHGGADRATRGPTGFTEADANLAVSLRLGELLRAEGAEVVLTRSTDETVPLGDRPRLAVEAEGDLLVSVHNNAFPDGVDPWANHGTSVYYFHPQSAELARRLQLELLDELGTRDLGVGRADLALVRPSWMPAVLSETLFMMIPDQEAALRTGEVQQRIALAHLRAILGFVESRATR